MPDLQAVATLTDISNTEAFAVREVVPEDERGVINAELALEPKAEVHEADGTRELGIMFRITVGNNRGRVRGGVTATYAVPFEHQGLIDSQSALLDFANRQAVPDLFPYARALVATLSSLILSARVLVPIPPPGGLNFRPSEDDKDDEH